MRPLTKYLIGFFVLLIVIQVYRPTRDNPREDPMQTIHASLDVPEPVYDILERACADCHSNRTEWPWYSNVAPVSWLVVDDVEEGRDEMNMSEWGRYNPRRAEHKLEELCENVEEGEMPLSSYVLVHSSSELTEADVETLCSWTRVERDVLRADHPEHFKDADAGDSQEYDEADEE